MSKTQPARGMRDFLPADVRKRNYVIGIIKEVYESYGFEPLETPSVENLETLTGKYGEEGNQLIFKILKRRESFGEELDDFVEDVVKGFYDDENPVYPPEVENKFCNLALRYDLTVPLARVVANYRNELPKFFKRYQIQPVWRADRPARGRFREFYQCDVDAIGSKSMIVEAELCAAVSEILERLGFNDFAIRLNHRGLLDSALTVLNVPKEKHTNVLIEVDKLDKIGKEAVVRNLKDRKISDHAIEGFMNILNSMDSLGVSKNDSAKDSKAISRNFNHLIVEKIKSFFDDFEEQASGITDIEKILELVENSQFSNKIKLDFSLARGLSYYTGAIFEINVPDLAGSLGGGGRYDGLIGMFGKEQIPACGFSLGLERILVVMEERGMFQKLVDDGKLKLDSADVMVASFDESLIGECLKLADDLRKSGLRVIVYPEANNKIKPIKYAEQIKIPFVCLVKENDLAENKVTLKSMLTGEQETIELNRASEKIKKH